jgi:adenine phosphoribosyltransferase
MHCSADAYLYCENEQLYLGVTTFEISTPGSNFEDLVPTCVNEVLGPQVSFKVADGISAFEAEMYISEMHGGHSGGKTSSFKRCLFLKGIEQTSNIDVFVAAVNSRPTPLCYIQLLHSSRAIRDVEEDSTAFGYRDWDFACVVTGVWYRTQDESKIAAAAVRWVYEVARELLPLSSGAYGADLGPDPRDKALAAKAFGPNLPRLARLKSSSDPQNVLSYACPLPRAHKLIALVTGEPGAGKDYCAGIWVSVLFEKGHIACMASISEATKRQYATVTGADLKRLLNDRAYKEQYRPALSHFFQNQVRKQPRLPEEHFLNLVYGTKHADVLFVTGMRDEAPVATFSHLVPESRLIEVRIEDGREVSDPECHRHADDNNDNKNNNDNSNLSSCRPSISFNNTSYGAGAAKDFAKSRLLCFLDPSLLKLADMAHSIPNFPRPGIDFRHILDISQQPGGLALCTSLMKTHFSGDWTRVSSIVCVEVGGYIYASALALQVNVPLTLIRKAGKLPPPTVEVAKNSSHVSSLTGGEEGVERIGVETTRISKSGRVVIVDDVLATGNTLCAVLKLLSKAGVAMERVCVMTVAEFPIHRGRAMLLRRGFKKVNVQSLLVFDGA